MPPDLHRKVRIVKTMYHQLKIKTQIPVCVFLYVTEIFSFTALRRLRR